MPYTDSISLDVDKFLQGLNQAKSALESWVSNTTKSLEESGRRFDMMTERVKLLGKAIALELAPAVAIGELARRSAEAANEMENLARMAGVSTDFIQRFQVSIDRAGISNRTFIMSMNQMTHSLEEARKGTGDGGVIFKTLGINIEEALKDREGTILKIADAISKMENGTAKLEIVTRLFGFAGVKMLETLDKGSEGLRKEMELAKQLGAVLDQDTIAALSRLSNEFSDVGTAMKNVFQNLGAIVAPAVEPVVLLIRELIGEVAQLAGSDALLNWGRATGIIMNLLVMAFREGTAAITAFAVAGYRVATLDFSGAAEALMVFADQVKDISAEHRKSIDELVDKMMGRNKEEFKKLAAPTIPDDSELQSIQKNATTVKAIMDAASNFSEAQLKAQASRIETLKKLRMQELEIRTQAAPGATNEAQLAQQRLAIELNSIEQQKRAIQDQINLVNRRFDVEVKFTSETAKQEAAQVRLLKGDRDADAILSKSSAQVVALRLTQEGQVTALEAQTRELDAQGKLLVGQNQLNKERLADALKLIQLEEQNTIAASDASVKLNQIKIQRANAEITQQEEITKTAEIEAQLRQQSIDAEKEKLTQLIAGQEDYAKQLSKINTMIADDASKKAIDAANAAAAAPKSMGESLKIALDKYVNDTDQAFNLMNDAVRQTADAMRQGMATLFFDVMNNKITSLKDALGSMITFAQQIVSQVAAQLATQALFKAVAGGGGGLGPGVQGPTQPGFFASIFGQEKGGVFPQFAGGGVFTPVPVHFWQGGGVAQARRPQMAVFGEGSMPEAFVPLPDGRTIPVSMKDGGKQPLQVTIVNQVIPPTERPSLSQADVVNIIDSNMRNGGSIRKTIMRGAR